MPTASAATVSEPVPKQTPTDTRSALRKHPQTATHAAYAYSINTHADCDRPINSPSVIHTHYTAVL